MAHDHHGRAHEHIDRGGHGHHQRRHRHVAEDGGGGGGGPSAPGLGGPFRKVPVPGASYSNSYDAARVGHDHQGIDLMAPSGRRILAPFDGRFRFYNAGSTAGYAADVEGQLGVIRNFHCLPKRARPDGRVKAGEVIGYVGATGNASVGAEHSHFEYHPGVGFDGMRLGNQTYGNRSDGTGVNPFPYLNAVYGKPGTAVVTSDTDDVRPHDTLNEVLSRGESWAGTVRQTAHALLDGARRLGQAGGIIDDIGR